MIIVRQTLKYKFQTDFFSVTKTKMGLSKLTIRWVPRLLIDNLKQRRMEACKRNLPLVNECGGNVEFLSFLVTSDESRISHFESETKQQSKVSTLKGSDLPIKTARSA